MGSHNDVAPIYLKLMINVTSITLQTYGGENCTFEILNGFFYEPLWKVKEILLDKFIAACKESGDPFVKVVRIKYSEYGQS